MVSILFIRQYKTWLTSIELSDASLHFRFVFSWFESWWESFAVIKIQTA